MLAFTDLHFAYRPHAPVLRAVSATLHPGQLVAILGPNGSGKSTLLRLALGTLAPTRGQVILNARPTHRLTAAQRAAAIGYIAQSSDLAEPFTVRHTVSLGRLARPRDDAAIDAAIDRCRLADRAGDLFAELSAGQQQRAALARVLAQLAGGEPAQQLILADEPASAMDPRHALFTLDALRTEARRGVAVAVVLHDPALAEAFADRVLLLDDTGALAADGLPPQVLTAETLERVFHTPFSRAPAWLARRHTPAPHPH